METKRKLEFKDIARYMPYGLVRIHTTTKVWSYCSKIDLTQFKQLGIESNVFLPILRPISDLYKKIIHNGKKIIPIVKLAKIYDDGLGGWKFYIDSNFQSCARKGSMTFMFKDGNFIVNDWGAENVYNQTQLFDWLDEHLFDYRGLIDAGLAVDVNTLEENPYK